MTAEIVQGDARNLPLADGSVDLIVTSPPYWALRSYTDGGNHYDGQIGAEPTPAAYIDNLIECTAEWIRVLKPTGSLWINLGDKYAGSAGGGAPSASSTLRGNGHSGGGPKLAGLGAAGSVKSSGVAAKSLIGLPWRYALRCIDDLGLILRAEIIWSKPNGLPESVRDRVRRSHETWFHFTRSPRYYSAVDAIREAYSARVQTRGKYAGREAVTGAYSEGSGRNDGTPQAGVLGFNRDGGDPLGKLPGSVWTISAQPLKVPAELGVDHFAAFPMEWPRRIISGWSPSGICTACGEGRRPVAVRETPRDFGPRIAERNHHRQGLGPLGNGFNVQPTVITGEACACPDTSAPTQPAVVLDPFAGTGTTVLVASALGRHGIGIEKSADYCRLAQWRTNDPGQIAAVTRTRKKKPTKKADGQMDLLEGTL